MKITKAAALTASGAPDKTQLEKINQFAKGALQEDEVYVFAVRLCDDQPDRDDERFSGECLRELAELFIGKTGVVDHTWSAEKQVARIFQTEVIKEAGAEYLKAWAYMLRTAQTEEFIREIEGGIKKEVSISCAVSRRVCSVCGSEYGTCEHRKGQVYGAERCAVVLCEAADAYEFSFVAVPAQKQAGVVKKQAKPKCDEEQARLLKEAEFGRLYRRELEEKAMRASRLLELGAGEGVWKRMLGRMEPEDLREFSQALEKKAAGLFTDGPQMAVQKEAALEENSAFLI